MSFVESDVFYATQTNESGQETMLLIMQSSA